MTLLDFIKLYSDTDDIARFLDETDAHYYQVIEIDREEFLELLEDNLYTTIYEAYIKGDYICLDLESCNMRFAIDMWDDMYYWREVCDDINDQM